MTPGKAKNKKNTNTFCSWRKKENSPIKCLSTKMQRNENKHFIHKGLFACISVRLLLYADDFEVSLPCLRLRLAGIVPEF